MPGYLHMDIKYLPQMADETTRRYLFVAIDHAIRWVYVAIKPNKTAASARAFLKALHKACPIKITKSRTPQTNGMVERFNGYISDILKNHHCSSGEDLAEPLHRYVFLYNHQLPQSALGSKSPIQAMKEWFTSNPELSHRRPYDRPGCDN